MTTGFLRHHYAAPRFWPFQLIGEGWLLVVAVLLLTATVRFVRHRAARLGWLASLADAGGCRMPDAPPEPQAGASLERPADRRTARRSLSRWAVHLGLLCSAAAALGTLELLHVRIAIHTDVGLVFVGLVVVHLAQRRRTLARMAIRIVRARTIAGRGIRLAVSDLLLLFITLNVLVSGVLDWNRGMPIQLPIPGPFGRWHAISALALVVYLAVHVWRRRKRLRRSAIR